MRERARRRVDHTRTHECTFCERMRPDSLLDSYYDEMIRDLVYACAGHCQAKARAA
jgi:hypothetical protein